MAGVIRSAALLEDSVVVAAGAAPNPSVTLPIGVTVATGSACTAEPAPSVGGAATVGNTAVLVSARVCATARTVLLSDGWSSPVCTVPDVACWVAIT